MQVSLITPQESVFSGQANDLRLVAEAGEINLLENHANIITLVKPGKLKIIGTSGTSQFDVSEGVLRVEKERCSILCMSAKAC